MTLMIGLVSDTRTSRNFFVIIACIRTQLTKVQLERLRSPLASVSERVQPLFSVESQCGAGETRAKTSAGLNSVDMIYWRLSPLGTEY